MRLPDTPHLNKFIGGCRNVTDITGVPYDLLFVHGLLLATALAGGKACYRKGQGLAPRTILTPATILSDDEAPPGWFAASTLRFIETQESLKTRARSVLSLMFPAPAMVRRAKRMTALYAPIRDLLPDPMVVAVDCTRPRMVPDNFTFIHDLRTGSAMCDSELTVFGNDMLALATGDDCHSKLFRDKGKSFSILAKAADDSALPRVTIHGWGRRLPLRKAFRKAGMENLKPLGMLLEFPESDLLQYPDDTRLNIYMRFFEGIFNVRLEVTQTFMPAPEIVSALDQAMEAQERLAAASGLPSSAANPVPELPWNLATAMWLAERGGGSLENNPEVANLACRFAEFIHQNHLQTLRRIFPPRQAGTTDPVNAAIVDKLAVKPLQFHALTRKFHRIKAEELRQRLSFLAEVGLARQNAGQEWLIPAVWDKEDGDNQSELSADC